MAAAVEAPHLRAERVPGTTLKAPASYDGIQKDQHGACSGPKNGGVLPSRQHPPQIVHECTLQQASDGLLSVTALACSPVGSRVCAATKDRTLRLLGGSPGNEDTFSARAAEKGKPLHLVTGTNTSLPYRRWSRLTRVLAVVSLVHVCLGQKYECMQASLSIMTDPN